MRRNEFSFSYNQIVNVAKSDDGDVYIGIGSPGNDFGEVVLTPEELHELHLFLESIDK